MHLDALLFISDQLFGKGYYTSPQLKELSETSILRVAILEEEVIGFFVFRIVNKEDVLWMNSNVHDSLLEVKTIAVNSNNQGKGIGSKMLKEADNYTKMLGLKNSYCVAWRRVEKVPLHNILIRNEYNFNNEIENYWYEDSIKYQFQCPECGIPCSCSALIYQKMH